MTVTHEGLEFVGKQPSGGGRARSNAFTEHWVKSVKGECLSKLILFGETSLRRALHEYFDHYHVERNHQGKSNILLFTTVTPAMSRVDGSVDCKERVGGLLKFYHREAA